MNYSLVASIFLSWIGLCCTLSLCPPNGDTYGNWNVTSTINKLEARRYFVNGFYSEAAKFSKIWLPSNCTYHRFTKTSLQAVASHLIASGKSKSKDGKLHLSFFGDSALRGIMCGILRILSGSEIFGPNSNVLCGHPRSSHPPSIESEHKLFTVDYGNITISFVYIQNIESGPAGQELEMSMFQKPYSIIYNTGAWSFYDFPIKQIPEGERWHTGDDCETPRYINASKRRTQILSQEAYARVGKLSQQLGVKLVYRTNHFNIRYGVECADGALIPILRERHWDIWDNTRVSKDVWQEQTYDGFHFDRVLTHTVEQHREIIEHALQNNLELPGMLEIQFAQSLLHFLFRDTIQEFITKGIELPIN